MLYIAAAMYVSMAHLVETKGLVAVCSVLAEETKLKQKARGPAEYAIPIIARITAMLAVVMLTGRLMHEA